MTKPEKVYPAGKTVVYAWKGKVYIERPRPYQVVVVDGKVERYDG